jgi:penicillin-binding protein 1A
VTKQTRKKKSTSSGGFFSFLFKWIFVISIWGFIAGSLVLGYHLYRLPKIDGLLDPVHHPKYFLYDRDDNLFFEVGGEVSEVQTDEIPDYLRAAVISIEDRRFYDHFGIDVYGLSRAMWVNFRAGSVVQGGSTLTQQLAKNLFLTKERNMSRKIQEAILALWLEWSYSKEEILTAYLNRTYFGAGVFGVDAAAHKYFGKDVSELTVGESALLAGLLKAPSRYSPFSNKEKSVERTRLVLQAMADSGYLYNDPKNIENYVSEVQTRVSKIAATYVARYYADYVAEQIELFIDPESREDLHVFTMLDMPLQKFAENKIKTVLEEKGAENEIGQGAFVFSDLDGGIMSIVGGNSYAETAFNRATKAKRQPGSSIKPIYYLAAFERGLSPQDIVDDAPISLGNWSPDNFNSKFKGPVTVERALALSLNGASIRVLQRAGLNFALDMAKRLGITSPMRRDMTFALGTSEITLIEMVRAYTTMGNGGFLVYPYVIKRIENTKGETVYEREATVHVSGVSEQAIRKITDSMKAVVRYGTGRKAGPPEYLAGKSGTSQNSKDAWFYGITGDYVGGMWFGNDDSKPMKSSVTGGAFSARVFAQILEFVYHGRPMPPLVIDMNSGIPYHEPLPDGTAFISPDAETAPAPTTTDTDQNYDETPPPEPVHREEEGFLGGLFRGLGF